MELNADFARSFPGGLAIEARLRVPAGGFAVTILFGPSGCGKTTTLRCLAGLDRPDRGTIRFGEETWADAARGAFLPPQRRGIGYLMQDHALFPHMTVLKNVAYGLASLARSERESRAAQAVDLFGLRGLERRYPRHLSSGERQRAALARAVAPRPRLLLLDEPLSALDAPAREALRSELRRLLAAVRIPAVVVTHDLLEATALGDRMAVMEGGRVRQEGPIAGVLSHPESPEVARIVGVRTIVPGRVTAVADGLADVSAGDGAVALVGVAWPGATAPSDAYVCIRAEDVVLERAPSGTTSARNRLAGRVSALEPEGAFVRATIECGFALGALVTARACAEMGLAPGGEVTAVIKAPSIRVIPRASSAAAAAAG